MRGPRFRDRQFPDRLRLGRGRGGGLWAALYTGQLTRPPRRPRAPTCRELRMANAYWKATAWLLTASTPKTQEVPRMGSSTATAFAVNLEARGRCLGGGQGRAGS